MERQCQHEKAYSGPEVTSLVSPCVARTRPCGLRDFPCPCRHSPPGVGMLIPRQFSHLLPCAKATGCVAAVTIDTAHDCGHSTLVWLHVAHGVAAVEEGAEMVLMGGLLSVLVIAKFRESSPRVGLCRPVPCDSRRLVILPDSSKLCTACAAAWVMKHAFGSRTRE